MKNNIKKTEISAIRMIAMLMIIACHIMQYYDFFLAWWLNVGVQIFLCLSGYLYGRKKIENIIEFYRKRLLKILVPYYLTLFSFSLVQYIFSRETFNIIKLIKAIFLRSTITGAEHLWFVPTILFCYLITPLLQSYRDEYIKNKRTCCIYSILSVFIVSIYVELFSDFFNSAWIACYVIGYSIGINEKNQILSLKTISFVSFFIMFIGNVMQIYLEYFAHISFRGSRLFYNYNHVFLGLFLFLILIQLFKSINNNKIMFLLNLSDIYSYEIYLVHQLVILGPFSLLGITKNILINLFLVCITILCLACLLKNIEEKVFSTKKIKRNIS